MPKCPKLDPKLIREEIATRLANHDRSPFVGLLADAVHYKPRVKDWRKLREDPERHARTLTHLSKLSGFVDRSESVHVKLDATQLAETLVARYGETRARQMLELHNLPASLIPQSISADPHSSEPEPLHDEIAEPVPKHANLVK